MGGHDGAAYGFHLFPEEGELVHTEDVFLQSEDEEVALFRVYLAAREDENSVAMSKEGQFIGVPEGVVLRDADAV